MPRVADPGDETVTITMHGWAHGGEAVGRLPDGRACFVPYTLPGERVEVRVRRLYKRHATADLVRVIDESPHRVQPPCPYFGACGGCQLQHVAPAQQLTLKAQVLSEQLQRIGRVTDPPVRGVTAPQRAWPTGYRAWARMAVDEEGRLGFRQARSHDVQPIDRCLLLDGPTQQLRDKVGDEWREGEEVTLTTGSDGAMVMVTGNADLDRLPEGPFGVVVTSNGAAATHREPDQVHITVHGVALRASADAFFQAGPGCAEALVTAVLDVSDVGPGDTVWDLYAGGGLLSVFLADRGASVTAVEADPVAGADAVANLVDHDGRVVTATVEDALPLLDRPVDVIVLDPPRRGAGTVVCREITGAGARQIVYVACDPAALARDTVTLRQAGYDLVSVDGLDLFGHTAHIEAVAVFRPTC